MGLAQSTDEPPLALSHPDAPRKRASFLIGDRVAGQLEGQLNLAVVIALVPEHVLQEEDGMVVVEVHGLA